MKIKSLYTNSFGKFNQKKWSEFSPSINIFYGENEAGKSTIFKMISRLIFGFQTLNKEKNLLVNQESGQLHIGGELEDHQGNLHIERTLKSKPQLQLSRQGQLTQGDNEAIVEGLDYDTYSGVYALNLDGLGAFKDQSWQDIEQMLMQQYSGDVFKSPQAVLEAIEKEIKQVKKQSDRGNSIIKSLEEQKVKLFTQKKHIQEKRNRADDIDEKLNRLDRKIKDMQAEKLRLMNQLSMLEVYLPLKRLMDEKKILDQKLDGFQHLKHVDEVQYFDKKKQLKKYYDKLEEKSSSINKLVEEKRRKYERIQSASVTENELKDIIQKHMKSEELFLEKDELAKKVAIKEDNFKKAFEETFSERYNPSHVQKVLDLNYLNMKSLVKELEEIYEEIKVIKRNKRSTNNGSVKGKVGFMIFLMILASVGIYIDYHLFANLGCAFVIGLSITNIIHLLVKARNKTLDEDDLHEEKEALKARLLDEVKDIKLSSIVKEFIGQEFITQVIQMRHLAEQFVEEKSVFDGKFEQMMQLKSEVNHYLSKHVGEIENQAKHFDELMDQVIENRKHQSRIEVINGQLDMYNDDLRETEIEMNQLETWLTDVEASLKAIGGSVEEGLKQLNHKKQNLLRRDEILKRISQQEYVEEVLDKFMDDYEDTSFFDKHFIQNEIEKLTQKLNDEIIAFGGLEKDKLLLLEQSDMAAVESEISYVGQRLKEEKIRYDKLKLLHHLVKTTDEKYRLENQPRVFKKASQYLCKITEGRYSNLEVVELKDKTKERFVIMVNQSDQRVMVDASFSLGTLNQIYFSLRLALMDHLDSSQNRLPICFDELLVNWDQGRLNQTLKIIETISNERQVFVFTCHEWLAESLAKLEHSKRFDL